MSQECQAPSLLYVSGGKHIVNKALQPKGEEIVTHENMYLQPEREEETYTFLSMHNNIC